MRVGIAIFDRKKWRQLLNSVYCKRNSYFVCVCVCVCSKSFQAFQNYGNNFERKIAQQIKARNEGISVARQN